MDPHQVQEEFSSFLESPSFLESGSSTRTASMTRSSSTKASVLTMTPAQFKARVLNTKTWRGREKGRKPRLAKAKAKAKATTPAKSKKTSTSASKTAEKKTTAPTAGSGRSAGLSGKTGGKSGKTSGQSGRTSGKSGKTSGQSGGASGKSGKTSGQSGRTSGKSGKTSGQSGRTSGKSGKTSGQSGGASGKSGKTSGESGRGSGKSGKTSGTSGRDGGKSGKTSGTSGKDGGKSGKTSGTSGKNGGKSGKTSGTGGKDSGKSGKTSGNGSKKKTTSNDPARVALPPSQKQKKASTAAEQKRMEESGEWISKMGRIAASQTTASVAGKRGRELAIASMLAAGVSQADIDKVLQTLLGMTIRNGAVGFASGVSEQLGTCASCWAYTAADALQRIHLRLGGVLSRVPLSSQQLIDCVKSVDTKGCMGGSPLDALDYWQKNAVALLSEYPSKPTAGKCKPYASVTQRPPVYASYGWDMLIPACDDMTGDCKKQVQYEHLLVDWVKLGGTAPIVYIDATNMQNHKGSIFDISKCQSTMEAGNHVVQIIGFSTDPETGAPFWMLQNSWGEYGRMRVPFGLNACGLANFVIVPTDPAMSHQSGAGSSTTTEQTLQNLRAATQQLATASPLKANLGSPTPSLTPAGSQSFTSQVNANRAAAAAAGQPAPAPSTVQRGASFDDPFLQAILDGKIPASGTIVQGVIQNTPK